jgi:threonine-phosphate decarboxylase
VDFSSNINPLGPSKKAIEAIRQDLWKIRYYPDSSSKELKKALSRYLGINARNITLGNGSTELIKNFCEVFLQKDSEAIIPEPTFSEYEVYSKLNGARIKHVYAKKEDFEVDHEKIIDEINNKTKVVFLCNPNNPTGKILEGRDIEKIIESAYDYDTLVFLDEAYIEFTDFESLCQKIEDFDNLFVLQSLTKFFSLAGLRVGYGIGNKKLIEYLEKVRIPWNVNILAQTAAIASINDEEFIDESKSFIKRERQFLFKELLKTGLKVYESQANFFLIDLREAKIKAPEMKKRLVEKGMLIRDCCSFNGLDEYFIRICVRKREENLRLLEELRHILEDKDA